MYVLIWWSIVHVARVPFTCCWIINCQRNTVNNILAAAQSDGHFPLLRCGVQSSIKSIAFWEMMFRVTMRNRCDEGKGKHKTFLFLFLSQSYDTKSLTGIVINHLNDYSTPRFFWASQRTALFCERSAFCIQLDDTQILIPYRPSIWQISTANPFSKGFSTYLLH